MSTLARGRSRRLAVLLSLLVVAAASPVATADARHPLEPADTHSPRGTLDTLLGSIDDAWARFLLLEEVLDRLELPPATEIPGEAEARDQDLRRWIVPHTEIEIVRVTEGPREGEFLFSVRTVGRLREFFEKVRPLPYQPGRQGAHYEAIRSGALSPVLGPLAARFPAWAKTEIGNQLVWQWGIVLASLLGAAALAAFAFRLGRRWTGWETRSTGRPRLGPFLLPVTVIALVALELEVFARFIRLAGAPHYYGRLTLLAIADLAIAWLIAVVLSAVGEFVIRHSRAGRPPLNAQLVRLSFRILTILVVTGFVFVAAESLGLPVPALVAGLGVGGLAVALATQGTLENLIGGLILYADQPVRVGDFFRFGDKMGIVEEIGIRSARIRTLDRTIVAIPNAELVRMQLENFSRRDKTQLATTLHLRMETTPEQLRYFLTRLERMLAEHPQLSDEGRRVRFMGVGEYSLDVELVAISPTTNWDEFLAIRQDVFLRAMGVVEEAGTRLAVPVQVELEGHDRPFDEDRRREVAEAMRRWREEGRLGLPEFPPR